MELRVGGEKSESESLDVMAIAANNADKPKESFILTI
jgi:hypothetical protein